MGCCWAEGIHFLVLCLVCDLVHLLSFSQLWLGDTCGNASLPSQPGKQSAVRVHQFVYTVCRLQHTHALRQLAQKSPHVCR